MDAFPHHYHVTAAGTGDGNISLTSDNLTDIEAAPPAEFGGPGDQWSPETLLASAVAACFVLSFRAIARASKFEWTSLSCDTSGTLDRQDRKTRFTEITNRVTLTVPAGASEEMATKLLHKAEDACLISNSLNADIKLQCEVKVE